MPRKKTGEFNQTQYIIEYNRENVARKFVPFNKKNSRDARLLEWARRYPNFTSYAKELIEKDKARRGSHAEEEERGV